MKKNIIVLATLLMLIVSCKKHSQQQVVIPVAPTPQAKTIQELLTGSFNSQTVIDSTSGFALDSSKYLSYYLYLNFFNSGYSGTFMLTKGRFNSIVGAKNGGFILMGNNNDSIMLINAPILAGNQIDFQHAYDTSFLILRSVNDTIINNSYNLKNFTGVLKTKMENIKSISIITFK